MYSSFPNAGEPTFAVAASYQAFGNERLYAETFQRLFRRKFPLVCNAEHIPCYLLIDHIPILFLQCRTG